MVTVHKDYEELASSQAVGFPIPRDSRVSADNLCHAAIFLSKNGIGRSSRQSPLSRQIATDSPVLVQFCFFDASFVHRFIKSFPRLPEHLTLASVLLYGFAVWLRPAI